MRKFPGEKVFGEKFALYRQGNYLLSITVRILGSGHVIDSLVGMLLFHEVVDEVP